MQDALLTITQSRTVPQVFIKGEFIGGCDGNSIIECSHVPGMCCPLSVLGMQCRDTGMCYECLVCVCADTLGAYSSGELAEKLSAAGVDAHF